MGSLIICPGNSSISAAEDVDTQTQRMMITRLIERISGLVIISTREPFALQTYSTISFEVKKPSKAEQKDWWISCLGKNFSNIESEIERIVSQFDLNASTIQSISTQALLVAEKESRTVLAQDLWKLIRLITYHKMVEFAEQLIPKYRMDNLVLPQREKQLLKDIQVHVKHRVKVYEEWGFDSSSISQICSINSWCLKGS